MNEVHVMMIYQRKGGVGKTSLSFALGWALALQGKRVLLIDADNQQSLWRLAVERAVNQPEFRGDHAAFRQARGVGLWTDMLAATREFNALPARVPQPYTIRPNLWILPGDDGVLSDWDSHIPAAEATIAAFPANANITGMPMYVIRRIAADVSVGADVVILDMNPNTSALNRCLWWGADSWIAPCVPDFFSYDALHTLASRLQAWRGVMEMHMSRTGKASVTPVLKREPAKFLGITLGLYQTTRPIGATDFSAGRVNDDGLLLGDFTALHLARVLHEANALMGAQTTTTPVLFRLPRIDALKQQADHRSLPYPFVGHGVPGVDDALVDAVQQSFMAFAAHVARLITPPLHGLGHARSAAEMLERLAARKAAAMDKMDMSY